MGRVEARVAVQYCGVETGQLEERAVTIIAE